VFLNTRNETNPSSVPSKMSAILPILNIPVDRVASMLITHRESRIAFTDGTSSSLEIENPIRLVEVMIKTIWGKDESILKRIFVGNGYACCVDSEGCLFWTALPVVVDRVGHTLSTKWGEGYYTHDFSAFDETSRDIFFRVLEEENK
jgi:hypothetical protein